MARKHTAAVRTSTKSWRVRRDASGTAPLSLTLVNVQQSAAPPPVPPPLLQREQIPQLSWRAMVVWIVAIVILGSVLAATAYGFGTQDFAPLKALASCIFNLISSLAAKSVKG